MPNVVSSSASYKLLSLNALWILFRAYSHVGANGAKGEVGMSSSASASLIGQPQQGHLQG